MTVSAIMMRRFSVVASVVETDDIDTVAARITHHKIGAVVVLGAAGRLVGIITEADVVQAFSRRRAEFPLLRAKDIMCADVHTCRSDETELEVMSVMTERQIRHMVVMRGETVVGLVTLDEAVRHRLQKIKLLNEKAAQEADREKRLALVDRHLKESWNIFEVFRAVSSVQEATGLDRLDDRSKQLLWLIGDGDNAGRPVQIKDLMLGHKWGSFPTIRKHLDDLIEEGLVEYAAAPDGRGKPYQLSQRGRDVFAKMTSAVSDTMLPLSVSVT